MFNQFSEFIEEFGENSIKIIKSSLRIILRFISSLCHGVIRFISEIFRGIINILKFIFSPFRR
ncbi:MAG TPA: hypothetical protein DCQ78_00315, partial [Ruminococcus sp.]|nr:hypothetical protein [Ruminococcus sp.]